MTPWTYVSSLGTRWFAQRTEDAQQRDSWDFPEDAVQDEIGRVLWLQPESGAMRWRVVNGSAS